MSSNTIRTFKFAKRDLEEGDFVPSSEQWRGVGSLELKVFGGNDSGPRVPVNDRVRMKVFGEMQTASEKAAMKKGISVGVLRDGTVVTTLSNPSKRMVSNWKPLDELSVVVHIRERSWLTRRRILTESGGPCTKTEADLMLASRAILSIAEPKMKKQKLEPVEAIDLT